MRAQRFNLPISSFLHGTGSLQHRKAWGPKFPWVSNWRRANEEEEEIKARQL